MSSVDLPDWLPATVPGGANVNFTDFGVVPNTVTAATTILPVAAFSQLILELTGSGPGSASLTLFWFQDAAGLVPLNFSQVFLKAGSNNTVQIVPVCGPYLKVSVHNLSGGSIHYELFIQGYTFTGRLSVPNAFGMWCPLDVQAAALGASATVDSSPFIATMGKAVLWVSAGQNYTGSLQRWNGATWDTIAHFAANANVDTVLNVNLPGDDWRVEVVNTAAIATTFSAVVTLEP